MHKQSRQSWTCRISTIFKFCFSQATCTVMLHHLGATANLFLQECDRESAYSSQNRLLLGNGGLKVSDLEKIRLMLSKPSARDARAKAKQLYICQLFPHRLGFVGINAHTIFSSWNWLFLVHLFKPGPLKNCPRVPLWSLVSLYLLWHLIHILSKEKFLNLSPNLEGIGCAAQGRFDMACAQKGSMSDAFRLTANGQLAQLYKQVHSTDFQVCLNSSLAVHTLYNILANCLAACIPLCICISCPIVFCTVYVTQFQAKWNYARCICYALIDNFGAQQLRKNYRIIIFF